LHILLHLLFDAGKNIPSLFDELDVFIFQEHAFSSLGEINVVAA
jgi:hypothetical protein